MSLEQVLNPQSEEVVVQPEVNQPDPGANPEGGGEPTSPETQNSTHVPLAALEAERRGRQDWKEKAIRYEEELKQLRQQPQQQFQQMDPLQSMQQQLINERFNMSEMLVRQQYKDVDDKVNVFMDAARENPALMAALQQQRNPWDFAYREGARMLMLKEVGDDPAAYRAKVEAEVLAKLQSQGQPQVNVPSSLNGARSVASRSAPAWTGPTDLGNILGNR